MYKRISLVAPDSVYMCRDIPHYEYISFAGSNRKMFNIASRADTSFDVKFPCFNWAAKKVLQKWPGKLVSCWTVAYNQGNSAIREQRRYYYIIDDFFKAYPANDETGGPNLISRTEEFERLGPEPTVEVCSTMNEFLVNPPNTFVLNKSGKYEPIQPKQKYPSGTPMEIEIEMTSKTLEYHGHNFVAMDWDCIGDSLHSGFANGTSPIY